MAGGGEGNRSFLTRRLVRCLNAISHRLAISVLAPRAICLAGIVAIATASTPAAADVWQGFSDSSGQFRSSDGCLVAQHDFVTYVNPQNPDPNYYRYFTGCLYGKSGPGGIVDATYSCHAIEDTHPNCPILPSLSVSDASAFWVSCDPGYQYIEGEGCGTLQPDDPHRDDPHCGFCVGDPINPATGLPIQHYVDYQTAGPYPLKFERYYANNDKPRFSASNWLRKSMLETVTGAWRSNFDAAMYNPYPGSRYPHALYFTLPSGKTLFFVDSTGSGSYVPGMYYVNIVNQAVSVPGGRGVGQAVSLSSDGLQVTLTDLDGTHYVFTNSLAGPATRGSLIAIQYPGGYSQTLNYDAATTHLSSVTDSLGRSIAFQYDGYGHLVALIAGGSTVATYSYIANPTQATIYSQIYSQIAPLGVPAAAGQASGALGSVTLAATNETTTYSYVNNPNDPNTMILSSHTDPRGVTYSTWSVDSSSRVVSNSLAGNVGNTALSYAPANLAFTPAAGYSAQTITTTITNPLGATEVATYALTASGNPQGAPFGFGTNLLLTQRQRQATNSLPAATTTYAYDSNQFLSKMTDAEGRVTTFVNDPATGLPTSITRGSGSSSAATTTYTWNTNWRVPTQIVEPGLTSSFTWSDSGQLTSYTQTDTTTTTVPYSTAGQTRTLTYAYSANGLLSSVSGPLANQTVSFTYNSTGFIQSITDEVGHVTTVTAWNGRGQPTSITDPNGVVYALIYDGQGRPTGITIDPSGLSATTNIAYDGTGEITQITRPNGAYLKLTYDGARRLTQVQDDTGATIVYTRDSMGNATARQIKDSSGTVQLSQTAAFDQLGRLLKFMGASNQTWAHAYDKTDNRISVTDPRSNVFGWSFDALNRLSKTTDEEANAETVQLNGQDDVTNYSDPRSLNTGFVRSGFGEVIQRTSPDTGTTVYVYNALGKPTQMTDGRGIVTNLTYDAAGRLLTKQYPASSGETITYTWDSTAGGNRGIDRVTRIDDSSGSIEWTYNSLGQVIQEKKTTAGVAYTVGYGYDLDGKVTRIIYPSGRIVNYYRGAAGLVTTVTQQSNAASSETLLAKWVTYQPFGPLQSLSYGNGLILWKTFTQDYNLSTFVVEQGSNSIINRAYTYWYNDFDITNVWDNNVTARTDNYVFTPSHRLQNVYGDWGTQTYWQDAVGNRTGDVFTVGSTTTTKVLGYPYNSNLYVGTTQGSTTLRSVTNDGAGNIVTDVRGSTTYNYHYNNRNRLDRLTIGSTVMASYAYDGLERMAMRTTQNMTPSATTHYIYDGSGRLLAEASAAGTTQREYVWLDDMPLALFADLDTAAPKQFYVHPDHLDRPSKMTDANQNVVWDAWYWPYGEVRSITGSATNNIRFPGQYFLVESGLHYNWHRHYDASIGRYTQADPLGLAAGPSLYLYAGGNPVSYTDPTGEFPWGLAFAALDIGLQLYENDGNWRCINVAEVGLSLIGGGLAGGLEKGAFRFKDFGSHTWDATRKWMNTEGIQLLEDGQARHHWLFERNQGIGRIVPDWIKNQPWNTNPISKSLNSKLGQYPGLAWLAAPGWARSLTVGAILTRTGSAGGGCDCK
ncbi:RHS repeat-associated core domain-containing protein [Bradyrhizobium sp. STM 3843]|uniref:RHS repeat-associated core domain-containing protein n=1 Tax=Bradyrhizobium sp. STM 3843 TaxID=551947 RepID=UPI001586659D|nr:RHS repeat-associated core domain-containing protein [Bradyrhizobium sp. STM 3843]